VVLAVAGTALADPCLVIYPTGATYYHYDPSEYYTAGPGDLGYDAAYDRGGEVLLEQGTGDLAYDVYQAPNLDGFVEDSVDQGYFFEGTEFDLVIDGFNHQMTTYTNILLVANALPESCPPEVYVDGSLMNYDAGLGFWMSLGDLAVSTPAQGNNYSDTITVHVSWNSCAEIAFWAFADEDYNMMHDGGECFTAFSHDTTVPTAPSSWSVIKGQYGGGED
jgi:hypothetical protein